MKKMPPAAKRESVGQSEWEGEGEVAAGDFLVLFFAAEIVFVNCGNLYGKFTRLFVSCFFRRQSLSSVFPL